jgi:hypothetical protein
MPGMIDPGHLAQADLADDLRPQMEGFEAVFIPVEPQDGPGNCIIVFCRHDFPHLIKDTQL